MQANLLRAKMAEAGYSQRMLAKAMDISENTLSNKMTGKCPFDVEEAIKICDVLKIESNEDKANIFLL